MNNNEDNVNRDKNNVSNNNNSINEEKNNNTQRKIHIYYKCLISNI